jgi:hypothetical protein
MASRADGGGKRRLNWRRIVGWAVPVFLLILPLVAKAPWTLSDYIFAAAMFGLVGGIIELAVHASRNPYYRAGVGIAVGASFLLIWMNGAVGIIGDEDNPQNLMFIFVIALAIAGSIVARFRADGMMRAMAVAAAAQALVAVAVVAWQLGASEPPGLFGVVALIGFFTLMWLVSAGLFRIASRDER